MSFENAPKHVADAAAAAAPLAAYVSGFSVGVTILASLVSMAWMVSSLWKLFFPQHFEAFVKRINKQKDTP